MATSGTSVFNLNIVDVIEEAFEQCGLRMRTGYDLRSARRSLDLLAIEWQNEGINFWTIDEATVSLVGGTLSYNLGAECVDVIEAYVRKGSGTSQQDYTLNRISISDYANLTNKNQQGRPQSFWVDKQSAQPVVYLWPVPEDNTYTLKVWQMARIEDSGPDVSSDQFDVRRTFLPALVAGLAFKLSQKYPEANARMQDLMMNYARLYEKAAQSDRQRFTTKLVPARSRL